MAERVVCPGDPGRALRLAQDLMEGTPRMLNHHRGLWGYTGTGIDGRALTVQGTGVGGPSAAAIVHELVALGARRIVRVGTATSARPEVALGQLIAVTAALASDGASRALGAGDRVGPDAALTTVLVEGADHAGAVASSDLLHALDGPTPVADERLAADLQTAALLAATARAGARAGVVLVAVADLTGTRIAAEALHAAELRAGRLALAALATA